ncbi:NeuD/PglB/VioB family sugar acetyltransferase [Planktomarina temperata]|nr:NeuD/PglB/VioB family sugar acetyltransferase [Planktomarina temperata]
MSELVLIGGGGHCNSVIDVIRDTSEYKIRCIVENKEKLLTAREYPYIFGDDKLIEQIDCNVQFFISIGQIKSSAPRERVFNLVKLNGGRFVTLKSKHSYVSKAAQIGEGTFIGHGAIINYNAAIGKNCIINSKSLIEHDVSIGSHSHISTGAIVNGSVNVGEKVFIGSGAIISNNITIGSGSIIGAGVVVKQDVSPNSLVS